MPTPNLLPESTRVKITTVTFPRLDVDYHLAPFVDARDHLDAAAARVTIGAPHFEKAREFWVRPVRWYRASERANLLLRPVEADIPRLLLATFAFKINSDSEILTLPNRWKKAAENRKKLFSSLARFWHEPQQNIRVGWKAAENPTLYLPGQQPSDDRWQLFSFNEARRFSPDEFADLPAEDFHNFLRQQAQNTQSQLYLSWQWHSLTRQQQWNRFFAGPIWKHYPNLLKNILQSEALYTPEIAIGGAETDFEWANPLMNVKIANRPLIRIPERSKKMERILYEYFCAQIPESCVPAHVDFQGVKAPFSEFNSHATTKQYPRLFNVLHVKCPAPTHHEMLEARLQLHAWARAHLPPARAQELIALDG